MSKRKILVVSLLTFLCLGFAGVVLAESGEESYLFSSGLSNIPTQNHMNMPMNTVAVHDRHSAGLLPTGLGMNELDPIDLHMAAAADHQKIARSQAPAEIAAAQKSISAALLPTGLGMSELDQADLNLIVPTNTQQDEKSRLRALCASGKAKSSVNCKDIIGG
jgi:hypothetical protein